MRNRNFWVFTGFGSRLGSLAPLSLCLGMLGSGGIAQAMLGLPPCCLPPVNQPQAIWLLAVALVPAPGLVLASTPFAQADPRPRSAPSGQTATSSRNVAGAHGRCFLPRESPGRMSHHSPRALSKYELHACLLVYRHPGTRPRTKRFLNLRFEEDKRINAFLRDMRSLDDREWR